MPISKLALGLLILGLVATLVATETNVPKLSDLGVGADPLLLYLLLCLVLFTGPLGLLIAWKERIAALRRGLPPRASRSRAGRPDGGAPVRVPGAPDSRSFLLNGSSERDMGAEPGNLGNDSSPAGPGAHVRMVHVLRASWPSVVKAVAEPKRVIDTEEYRQRPRLSTRRL